MLVDIITLEAADRVLANTSSKLDLARDYLSLNTSN